MRLTNKKHVKISETELLKNYIQEVLENKNSHYTSRMRKIKIVGANSSGLLESVEFSESYVVDVLGIHPKLLTESYVKPHVAERILKEHLLFESWWGKLKSKVSSVTKSLPVVSTVDAIKRFGRTYKAIQVVLASVVSSGGSSIQTVVDGATSLTARALTFFRKSGFQISEKLKEVGKKLAAQYPKIANFLESLAAKAKTFFSGIADFATSAMQGSGWKGMLTTLGTYLAVSFIQPKIQALRDIVISALSGDIASIASASVGAISQIGKLFSFASEFTGDDSGSAEEIDSTAGIEDAAAGDEEAKKVTDALEAIFSKIKSVVGGLVKGLLVKVGAEAITQAAGPVAWLKTIATIFDAFVKGSAWVAERLLEALQRATFNPISGSSGAEPSGSPT